MTAPNLAKLAIKIADQAAHISIKSASYHPDDAPGWLNIDVDSRDDCEELKTAASYLELRGRIRRHPKNKHYVKVLPSS